jgi:hypothetical protein
MKEKCKAICAECRHTDGSRNNEYKEYRCYFETEALQDCVTGAVTYTTKSCNTRNHTGDCEDFEHRPPKPSKRWWGWDYLDWEPIKGRWIMDKGYW